MAKIESTLGHLQLCIQNFSENVEIYKKCFEFLGYTKIVDEDWGIGYMTPTQTSIWILSATVAAPNDRDSNGLNHLGIHVANRSDVDMFYVEFMKPNGIEPLFETPRDRPDFVGENGTYYQVMFELPGSILFEVVYTV